jgi:hypothetical protein
MLPLKHQRRALVVNGIGTPDIPRRVAITSPSNESALTFTVFGTNRNDILISSAKSGPNAGTIFTNLDYKTVTKIIVSGNTIGAITVGTNQVASSKIILMDTTGSSKSNLEVFLSPGANLTYTVEDSSNDMSRINLIETDEIKGDQWNPHDILVGKIASDRDKYIQLPIATRIVFDTYTDGTATFNVVQTI